MSIAVEVVSPERILWSGDADMVIARTVEGGELAFLTDHAPFLGALDVATVTVIPSDGSATEVIAVHGGFVEVSNNRVTILSDLAELATHIDEERAREAIEELEERLRHEHDAEAEARLMRNRVRLGAIELVGNG